MLPMTCGGGHGADELCWWRSQRSGAVELRRRRYCRAVVELCRRRCCRVADELRRRRRRMFLSCRAFLAKLPCPRASFLLPSHVRLWAELAAGIGADRRRDAGGKECGGEKKSSEGDKGREKSWEETKWGNFGTVVCMRPMQYAAQIDPINFGLTRQPPRLQQVISLVLLHWFSIRDGFSC